MDLKATAVTPELASAALDCPELSAALRLAAWVGDERLLTEEGVLHPADAAQASAAVGTELAAPRSQPRGAIDVAGLMFHWDVALWAGLITVSGKRARRLDFRDLASDPGAALDAWLRAVAGLLGLPDAPCPQCLTTLLTVAGASAADGAIAVADVVEVIRTEFEQLLGSCPDCDELHAMDLEQDDSDPGEHAAEALAKLTLFGAVRPAGGTDDNLIRLTPLGQLLVDSVGALFAPAPQDSARAVLAQLSELPLAAAAVFARPWLAARTPAEAARELFDVAESASPLRRVAAIDLAALLGPESLPAWRERAAAPGYGAYIRAWLAEQGEPAPALPGDDAWLSADSLSAMLGQAPPGSASAALAMAIEAGGEDLAGVVNRLGESGHPDSRQLIELIREQMPARADRNVHTGRAAAPLLTLVPAGSPSYQFMITLRGVDNPPVWRRVAVTGSSTLNDLHQVIQAAMGWENDHMHIFRAGSRELSGASLLRAVLPRRGSRIAYEYDFGDSWEHDIRSEGFFQDVPGVTLPACLDGAGSCPPEDAGGVRRYEYIKAEILPDAEHHEHEGTLEWLGVDNAAGFDPAAFSPEEANRRLVWLRPPGDAEPSRLTGHPQVTVIAGQSCGRQLSAGADRILTGGDGSGPSGCR